MTAQISNKFIYQENDFDVLGYSKDLEFSPRDYGLRPVALHSALWSGYYYELEVVNNQLVIKNLYINNSEDDYPEILGVLPDDRKEDLGLYVYLSVNIPLDYSGKVLLGAGFINKYYHHMGYQEPYAYENLFILTFRDGILVEGEDISEKAALEREEVDKDPLGYMEKEKSILSEYIEKAFSLDIDGYYL